MKKTIYFFMALATIALSSCKKQEEAGKSSLAGSANATLTIGIADKTTKAAISSSESKINSLQVFVFRPDGTLDAYGSGTVAEITLSCTTGPKDIYAIVNAPSLSSITSKGALIATVSNLTDNSLTNFVMTGCKSSMNVTADATVSIPVSRIVARIGIAKITNKMSAAAYQNQALTVTKIYALNVAGSNNLGLSANNPAASSTWFNKMSYVSGPADNLIFDSVTGGSISYDASNTTAHYFYVYPNGTATDSEATAWSARFTRIVVEATLGGVTYFYPISIPGIASNKTYTITNLTITRPGSLSPDQPVTTANCTFNITVADWMPGTSGETII